MTPEPANRHEWLDEYIAIVNGWEARIQHASRAELPTTAADAWEEIGQRAREAGRADLVGSDERDVLRPLMQHYWQQLLTAWERYGLDRADVPGVSTEFHASSTEDLGNPHAHD